jgi:hypothetical protein
MKSATPRATFYIPDVDCIVPTATNQSLPIRANCQSVNSKGLMGEGANFFAGIEVPKLDGVPATTGKGLTIRANS